MVTLLEFRRLLFRSNSKSAVFWLTAKNSGRHVRALKSLILARFSANDLFQHRGQSTAFGSGLRMCLYSIELSRMSSTSLSTLFGSNDSTCCRAISKRFELRTNLNFAIQ